MGDKTLLEIHYASIRLSILFLILSVLVEINKLMNIQIDYGLLFVLCSIIACAINYYLVYKFEDRLNKASLGD